MTGRRGVMGGGGGGGELLYKMNGGSLSYLSGIKPEKVHSGNFCGTFESNEPIKNDMR